MSSKAQLELLWRGSATKIFDELEPRLRSELIAKVDATFLAAILRAGWIRLLRRCFTVGFLRGADFERTRNRAQSEPYRSQKL
ncbi:MAG: hypothetical protein K0U16_07530 [Gammaproteobacteria bacterium]|nr:hypothetical protein [Gammaproteobacteria bacterium]